MKQYAIKARLFRGVKTFNQNGDLTSENQTIDLPIYGSLEWKNFISNAVNVGYSDMKVISTSEITYEDNRPSYKDVETPENIIEEINDAFNPTVKVVLTPEQKEIADLKAQMKELMNGKPSKKESIETSVKSDDLLDAARKEYLEVIGKKAHHKMSVAKINEAIEEAKQ